jgi:1-acyl-sn-glycerol-3-phosphate acyltransferase
MILRRTIFDTPLLAPLLRRLAWVVLRVFGWRVEGERPPVARCVMIAAPHTSNWDLPMMLTVAFALRVRLCWMGKDVLFRRPAGMLFRWLGGIPVDRRRSTGMVEQAVEAFRASKTLVLVVPPEGTRSEVRRWKTGFYFIASGAGVPIALGFLDYGRKLGGIGPLFTPSGDLEGDMQAIRAFYADKRGKNPGALGAVGTLLPS